jgi:hypothetical protein
MNKDYSTKKVKASQFNKPVKTLKTKKHVVARERIKKKTAVYMPMCI